MELFFIYSILGHLIETFIYLFHNGKSGILYGFWTPVYGIGCLLILSIGKIIHKKNKREKVFLLFLISTIILSFIEWIGDITIEFFFHQVFWDYSQFHFHIGHYIALEMAIIWGSVAVIFYFFIHPKIDPFIKKYPNG